MCSVGDLPIMVFPPQWIWKKIPGKKMDGTRKPFKPFLHLWCSSPVISGISTGLHGRIRIPSTTPKKSNSNFLTKKHTNFFQVLRNDGVGTEGTKMCAPTPNVHINSSSSLGHKHKNRLVVWLITNLNLNGSLDSRAGWFAADSHWQNHLVIGWCFSSIT